MGFWYSQSVGHIVSLAWLQKPPDHHTYFGNKRKVEQQTGCIPGGHLKLKDKATLTCYSLSISQGQHLLTRPRRPQLLLQRHTVCPLYRTSLESMACIAAARGSTSDLSNSAANIPESKAWVVADLCARYNSLQTSLCFPLLLLGQKVAGAMDNWGYELGRCELFSRLCSTNRQNLRLGFAEPC